MSNQQLIVFVKNLIPGTVKTRLADEIGTDLALEVYKNLVMHTSDVTDKLKMDRAIYYSEYVELYDFFDDEVYSKHIQEGDDLGQRMLNAFFDGIEDGYEKVVLVGSDVPGLSQKIIQDAFVQLDDHDVVIGPAEDGGYYLIGMKNAHKQLFEGMEYSNPNVFQELVSAVESSGMKYATTETLIDLDTKEDMKKAGIEIVYEEGDDTGEEFDL